MKKWPKIDAKRYKNTDRPENDQKDGPGEVFFKEKIGFLVILGSQGGPLERPWKGFWEENFETKKESKKRGWRRWPRRDTRWLVRKGWDGWDRPDPARPGPWGWAGGLFVLRVTRRGHLEVGSFEALSLWGFGQPRNKNKNTRANKTRTHQEIGRLHQI